MYGHSSTSNNNNEHSYAYAYSADFLAQFDVPSNFPSAPLPSPPPLVIPTNDLESVTAALKLDFGYATSSGCSSYGSPSSLTSYGTSQTSELMMQRSVSSHSLHKHVNAFHQLVSSPTEFLDSDTSPVRKVFSTGDLQQNQWSGSPLSNNNESSSSIIEGMSKASRYSPEEKKEKIERYRSKRNQRNFNKKIKYECRKTLADSRPRIRGRFARNEETEKAVPQINNSAHQWNIHHDDDQVGGDIEEYHEQELDDDNNWVNFLNAFSSNLIP